MSELEGPAKTRSSPFLTDKEREAQRAEEACPRSESAVDSGFEPDFPDSQFGSVLFSGPRMASPSACCYSSRLCFLKGPALGTELVMASLEIWWQHSQGCERLEGWLTHRRFPALAWSLAQGKKSSEKIQ